MMIDEMVEVLLAYKQGKRIEYQLRRQSLSKEWSAVPAPSWDFAQFNYRVKPEFIKGYCFPHNISVSPRLGMIKVQQIELNEGENPIR